MPPEIRTWDLRNTKQEFETLHPKAGLLTAEWLQQCVVVIHETIRNMTLRTSQKPTVSLTEISQVAILGKSRFVQNHTSYIREIAVCTESYETPSKFT
jgi:hypothetical protein